MKKFTLLFLILSILLSYEIKAQTTVAAKMTNVSNFSEFQDALKNSSVTKINITNSIHFTKNIVDIPNRDVTIFGNKDRGVIINSNIYSIYGKQNYESKNTFSIINANINGDDRVGRFFTGGAGNGPSSYGWDVYAYNIDYKGARFVHLSEGTLTFDGSNTINTSCENAWVHNLIFKARSRYKGTAATIGQFSAFYFNGSLIKGKTIGTVDIQKSAQVDLTISPNNDKYYYYPAFYDKVYKVDVQNYASLKVNAAGVAFQFIPRADYLQTPSFNIGVKAKVELVGRGGGDYPTVKLEYYKASVNVKTEGALTIKGNSTKSVIKSIYKGAEINIKNSNLTIENNKNDAPLFYSTQTTLNFLETDNIHTWDKTGGNYTFHAKKTFTDFNRMNTIIEKNSNGGINTDNPCALTGFQIANYGKIKIISGGIFRVKSSKSNDNYDKNILDTNTIQCFSQNGTLTVTSEKEILSLEIYNLQGRLVIKEQINSRNISTTLAAGIYIIKASIDGQTVTKKILIK